MGKIVKISDISKFGDSLARSIRARLTWSSKLRKAVRLHKAVERGAVTSIQVTVGEGNKDLAGMARAFAFGSGLHATRGKRGTYKIRPRNFPTLQFEGTNAFRGKIIRVGEVDHPGVESKDYINKAIEATLAKSLPELKVAIRKNLIDELRLSIKGSLKS